MNAKTAKSLRRQARLLAQGKPDRQLIVGRSGVKMVLIDPEKPPRPVRWEIMVNDPNSIRGVYRRLKKGGAA